MVLFGESKHDDKEESVLSGFSKEEKDVYSAAYLEYLKTDLRKEIRFKNDKCQYDGCNNKPTIDSSKLKGDMYICRKHRRKLAQKFKPKDHKYIRWWTDKVSHTLIPPKLAGIAYWSNPITERDIIKVINDEIDEEMTDEELTDDGFAKFLIMTDEELYNTSLKESNDMKSDYFAHYNAIIEVKLFRIRSKLESLANFNIKKDNNNNNNNNIYNNNENGNEKKSVNDILREKWELQYQYRELKDLSKSLLMIRKLCNPIWLIFGLFIAAYAVFCGVAAYIDHCRFSGESARMINKLTNEIECNENLSAECETRIVKCEQVMASLKSEIKINERQIEITQQSINKIEDSLKKQDEKIKNFDWQIENYQKEIKEYQSEIETISVEMAESVNQVTIEENLMRNTTMSGEDMLKMLQQWDEINNKNEQQLKEKRQMDQKKQLLEEEMKAIEKQKEIECAKALERKKQLEAKKIALELENMERQRQIEMRQAELQERKKFLKEERKRKKEYDSKAARSRAERDARSSKCIHAFYVFKNNRIPEWAQRGYDSVFDSYHAHYGDYRVIRFESNRSRGSRRDKSFVESQVEAACRNNTSAEAIRDELKRKFGRSIIVVTSKKNRRQVFFTGGDKSQFVSENGWDVYISFE